jgi:aminopeptidase N
MKLIKHLIAILTFFSASCFFAQDYNGDSGGRLMPEQAAYDVYFYDLDLTFDIESRSIRGSNTFYAHIVEPLSWFVFDLDSRFTIDSLLVGHEPEPKLQIDYERREGRIWGKLPTLALTGIDLVVKIVYHGSPREAPNPPWQGGFSWKKTQENQPWVAVSCQSEGADIWWPCKDHPSDEPDSMSLRFTVPESQECASNGHLINVIDNSNGTKTFCWFVSTPINNYDVTFYIGPYQTTQSTYNDVTGGSFIVTYWRLQQFLEQRQNLFPEILQHMKFLEEIIGPYPFRIDKYGVADAPYLGMEHQSIIAYGNNQGNGVFGYDFGFDALHFHEFAHEWWGNMLSASDWRDMWLHEGFATYMEALYAERLQGQTAYQKIIGIFKNLASNSNPMAPQEPTSMNEIYGGDVYYKGACVLHTLRYMLGDSTFFTMLQRWAYPDSLSYFERSGKQCRFVTSGDLQKLVEKMTGKNLDWFFETYLHQAELPVLHAFIGPDVLQLEWKVDNRFGFFMPVEIEIRSVLYSIDMSRGTAVVAIERDKRPIVDPHHKLFCTLITTTGVLKDAKEIADRYRLTQNYPNPFNNETKIRFTLPEPAKVTLTLFNINGERVMEIFSGELPSGDHVIPCSIDALTSGIYFYCFQTQGYTAYKRLAYLK